MPVELTRDSTIIFRSADNTPQLAVCCEIQLKVDRDREWAWPLYLTKLHFDLKCPVVLLVLTTNPAVVRWCAQGFDTGHPGFVLIPLAIGPTDIGYITSAEEAKKNLALALLSVITHGDTPRGVAIIDAVMEAMKDIDVERASRYCELMLCSLKAGGKTYMEALMNNDEFRFTSDYACRLRTEGEIRGKAEGEVRSILLVLKSRGVPVTRHARDRIRACTDSAQLERWIERAVHVGHVDELFQDS